MQPQTTPPVLGGMAEIAGRYSVWLCDIWGVVHNGLEAFPQAVEALQCFRTRAGFVTLITNAPRPAGSVQAQLLDLGVPPDAYDIVVTSGDVTRDIVAGNGHRDIYHLGPDRDMEFFEGLGVNRVSPERAEAVICTGLFEDEVEQPEDYTDRLKALYARDLPLYCANPDIVVHRGDRLIPCAGALAALYTDIGGRVVIAGKPHRPIYQRAMAAIAEQGGRPFDRSGILAVGDGLATDIKGARDFGLDALFVSGGIHAEEAPATVRQHLHTGGGGRVVGTMHEFRW